MLDMRRGNKSGALLRWYSPGPKNKSTYLFVLRDAVNGSDAATEISVDDGAHVAVAKANIVQIPADFFDVDVALEGDPTSTEEFALGLRIRDRNSQEPRELLAHLSRGLFP